MSLDLDLPVISSWLGSHCAFFGRTVAVMMLCSHCVLLDGMQFLFVLLLMMYTLITLFRWHLPSFSVKFFFSLLVINNFCGEVFWDHINSPFLIRLVISSQIVPILASKSPCKLVSVCTAWDQSFLQGVISFSGERFLETKIECCILFFIYM